MKIVIDFDGTVVAHRYPEIGEDIGSVTVLKRPVACGHQLILSTMRSGEYLDEAVRWFEDNSIPLYGIQRDPEQDSWTSSPKAYGNLYIDDANLGIPLTSHYGGITPDCRPFVDWVAVEYLLDRMGLFVYAL